MTTTTTAPDQRVLVGLTHFEDEPENVLIAYLMAVEARRAGKDVALWLTKDAVNLAFEGYAAKIDVPGAPSVASLHDELVASGGRFFACPVCVKLRDLQEGTLVTTAEIKGAPSVYEFTTGGALVFNY